MTELIYIYIFFFFLNLCDILNKKIYEFIIEKNLWDMACTKIYNFDFQSKTIPCPTSFFLKKTKKKTKRGIFQLFPLLAMFIKAKFI